VRLANQDAIFAGGGEQLFESSGRAKIGPTTLCFFGRAVTDRRGRQLQISFFEATS
jgi:hypothetical protein